MNDTELKTATVVFTGTILQKESGWGIYTARHDNKSVKMVGTFPDVSDWNYKNIDVEYSEEKWNGAKQWKINRLLDYPDKPVAPVKKFFKMSRDAWILALLDIKNIGEVWAARIIELCGDDIVSVFANSNFETLRGAIPFSAYANLVAQWKPLGDISIVRYELQAFGLSKPQAKDAAHYLDDMLDNLNLSTDADSILNFVKEKPYRLTKVGGIGFKTADKIARGKLGFPLDDPDRVLAGSDWLVQNYENYGKGIGIEKHGNTCYGRDDFALIAAMELGVNKSVVEDVIDSDADSFVISETRSGVEIIQRGAVAKCEQSIAKMLHGFLDSENRYADKKIVAGLDMNEQQRAGVVSAFTKKISIITGGPGTGKTHSIKSIVDNCKRNKIRVTLLAPTGRASKRMSESTDCDAATIHRGLGLYGSENSFFKSRSNKWVSDDPFGIVVIDESSMVDIWLAKEILKRVPTECNIVFVGDADQLPSVSIGKVFRDLIEISCEDYRIGFATLVKNYRQLTDCENPIIENATRINAGELPIVNVESEAGGFFFSRRSLGDVVSEVVDLVATRLPKKYGVSPMDIQVLSPQRKSDSGIDVLNAALAKAVNQVERVKIYSISLGVGDKVMQTKNDYHPNYVGDYSEDTPIFNGSIGVVHSIVEKEEPTPSKIFIRFDTGLVEYTFWDFASNCTLAYAMTIHKSQGNEYDVVVIVMSKEHSYMLNRESLYTAVTRAKKAVIIVGEDDGVSKAVSTPRKERFTALLDWYMGGVQPVGRSGIAQHAPEYSVTNSTVGREIDWFFDNQN